MSEHGAEPVGGVGPGSRIARKCLGDESRLAFEPVRDHVFGLGAESLIRGDDEPDDCCGKEQARREEEAPREFHGLLRRYPAPRTVSIDAPALPSFWRSRCTCMSTVRV